MRNRPKITIQLVVYNGSKFIDLCLKSVLAQSVKDFEFRILDNNSSDDTVSKIRKVMPDAEIIESDLNLGTWPGHESILSLATGEYLIALSVDILLDKHFIRNTLNYIKHDPSVGAIQPKLLLWQFDENNRIVLSNKIDTTGFGVFRSRRLINVGHGQESLGQFGLTKQIFGVEGAVPIFKIKALEDIAISDKIVDDDYFWYGDDLDIAWRLTNRGWRQMYVPEIVAHHNRSTTHNMAHSWLDYLKRVPMKRRLPLMKRRLEWANVRFTIIKNDFIINLLKDSINILLREVAVFFYLLFFQPSVFREIPRFIRLLPNMLRRRKLILKRAKIGPAEVRTLMRESIFNE